MSLQARDILQLDATVIAGILIMLTLTGVFDKIVVPAELLRPAFSPVNQTALSEDPAYRNYAINFLLKVTVVISIGPFVISATYLLMEEEVKPKTLRKARGWSATGLGFMTINLVFLIFGSSVIGI